MADQLTTGRLVGRTQELALLGGEAGVGKTRLVEQFAAAAEEQGTRVLGGGCVPLGEEGLPFAPVTEALRGLVRDLLPGDLEVVAGPARQELGRLLPGLAWGGQAAAADPVSGRGGLECQESSTTEVSPATKSLHKGRAPAFSRYEVYVRIVADDPAAPDHRRSSVHRCAAAWLNRTNHDESRERRGPGHTQPKGANDVLGPAVKG